MLLSAVLPRQTSLSCSSFHCRSNCGSLLFNPSKPQNSCILCRARESNSSSSLRSLSSNNPSTTSSSATLLRPVSSSSSHGSNDSSSKINSESDRGGEDMVPSASAVAAVIRKVSTSPVEFVQRIEKAGGKNKGSGYGGGGLVLPSADFQRLCLEQLDLFRRIVHPDALLSIYVRPAGSYVMDQLELRRITSYPNVDVADIVILVGNFSIQAGLRAAEAALSSRAAEHFPELGALVFPMVKHPFVVGFLVAEVPQMVLGEDSWSSLEQSFFLTPSMEPELVELQKTKAKSTESFVFTTEQRSSATNISRSLAMAYVMDQKAMLLHQSSWQNNIRMSSLVEQIRGSLSSIQTLSKMLSVQLRRSEISYDIAQDIVVQGDHMRDTLEQLQDAVYLTKANIIRSNGGELKKINERTHAHPDSVRNQISSDFSAETSISPIQEPYKELSLTSTFRDSEVPMPPFALAPQLQEGIRPCNVSELLTDLVGAVEPLAQKQQRSVRLCELSRPLQVAIEEPALRQALSNLIEGALLRAQIGGKVEIVSTGAPAGGVLVIIDDDGPDMHYMTQMHSLTPFGMDLFAEDKMEDNMTWNFIAGLTVAREILESYGCVVRVISPRTSNLAIGNGGTRIELWLPFSSSLNTDEFNQMFIKYFPPLVVTKAPFGVAKLLPAALVNESPISTGESCDLFKEEWVPDPNGPYYTNNTCNSIQGHQNYMKNGRPDKGFLSWRWNPRDCVLPKFNPTRFLGFMRNKSMGFVGDSIIHNHVQSLLCTLSLVEEAVEVFHNKEYRSKTWYFPSHGFTLSVLWSPFLSKATIFEDDKGVSTGTIQLHLDELDPVWTKQFENFNYTLIAGGKWFLKNTIYYVNNTVIGCHNCQEQKQEHNITETGFVYAYRKVLNTTLKFITNSNNNNKKKKKQVCVMFRTITPDHFENGGWNKGGYCNRTRPFKEGEVDMNVVDEMMRGVEVEEFEKTAADIGNGEEMILKLMDITNLSLLRPDGHPGAYSQFHPFAEDKKNINAIARVQNDCLHWCLPGHIDSWNDLMLEILIDC